MRFYTFIPDSYSFCKLCINMSPLPRQLSSSSSSDIVLFLINSPSHHQLSPLHLQLTFILFISSLVYPLSRFLRLKENVKRNESGIKILSALSLRHKQRTTFTDLLPQRCLILDSDCSEGVDCILVHLQNHGFYVQAFVLVAIVTISLSVISCCRELKLQLQNKTNKQKNH